MSIIYRYRPLERADELTNSYIRYSPWWQLNDPFEFLPRLEFNTGDHLTGGKGAVDDPASKAIASSMVTSHHYERFRREIGFLGVACFSRDPLNLVMWHNYAGGHKGFVLGFDPECQPFKGPERRPEAIPYRKGIDYVKQRRGMRLPQLTTAEGVSSVLFTKPVDWEYEKEVRLIHPIPHPHHEPVNGGLHLPFPLRALQEVIVGFGVTEDEAMKLHDAVSKKAPWIKWYRTVFHSEDMKLDRMPMPIRILDFGDGNGFWKIGHERDPQQTDSESGDAGSDA